VKTYILIVHQALYFRDKLKHNLLNPFQCGLNGVNIKECPHILDPAVADDSYSIMFPNNELKTCLLLNRMVSYFPSCRPTYIKLISSEVEWNPHNGAHSNGESSMTGDDGNLLKWMAPHVQTREIMGLWTSENMANADNPFLERIERRD
jgi:hypothetical protein